MTILICPDKFKGSLTARAAAEAMARGVRNVLPDADIIIQPLADGGEGTLELLAESTGMQRRRMSVTGPLRRPVEASYLLGNGRAAIEVAEACGLHLVPAPRRHPKNTTTLGVGMLIEDALARGARDISLFLGGSSTSDCGAGMAAGLGYQFFGPKGEDFIPMADSLEWVARIDPSKRVSTLGEASFTAVCDVSNPLLGEAGATYTYAEQKGAAPEDLPVLEHNMARFAARISDDLGIEVRQLPGGGAAGGLGAGAVAFLGASLRRGIEVVFDAVDFERLARKADFIITGEGKLDRQTLQGKVVAGVAGHGKPTLVVCGLSEVSPNEAGVAAIRSIMGIQGMTQEIAVLKAAAHVERLVTQYLQEEVS